MAQVIFALGVLLSITGIFLPWKCWGDIVWSCPAGIGILPANLLLMDSFKIAGLIVFACITTFLLLTVKPLEKIKFDVIAGIMMPAVGCFLIDNQILINHGGIFLLACTLAACWLEYRSSHACARLFSLIITLAGAAATLYFIGDNLSIVVKEMNQSGGTAMDYGLFVTLAGELILIAVLLWQLLSGISASKSGRIDESRGRDMPDTLHLCKAKKLRQISSKFVTPIA